MPLYNVTYYYLATGMEGRADTEDYGVVKANNKIDAIEQIVQKNIADYDSDAKDFFRGCLSIKLIKGFEVPKWYSKVKIL